MPYFITDRSPNCDGWATIKQDGEVLGCHNDKQSAIDQMVALSLAEDIEPGGERELRDDHLKAFIMDIDNTLIRQGKRSEPVWAWTRERSGEMIIVTGRPQSDRAQTVEQLADLEITYDRLIMNDGSTTDSPRFKMRTVENLLETYEIEYAVDDNAQTRRNYGALGITAIDPANIVAGDFMDDENHSDESRAVDLSAPMFMRAAAKQGLKYYAEGKGGDGLVDKTIREARAMAAGNVTADKWIRIRAWIARHLDNLDAPNAKPSHPDYPSPGVVAHLLWGSGPSKSSANRALDYANRVIAKLEAENQGRAKGESVSKMETRTNPVKFELRETESGGMVFEGYAALFDSPSEPLPFTERIERGAFRQSLRSRNDIKLLWNHDTGSVLGSTRAKTLQLVEDERGLFVRGEFPNTSLGRDAAELIKRGDVDSMSFGFTVIKDNWNAEGNERTLKQVRLHEVSVVAFPAYSATAGTTSMRALDRIAERVDVDAESLADAMLKVESGTELTAEESDMLRRVIAELSPAEPQIVTDDATSDLGHVEVVKKKLELMQKGI